MPTIFRLGLENAIAATLLALLAVAASYALKRRPAVRHCLWLLVLVKLVTPPIWTVSVPWPAQAVEAKPETVAVGEVELEAIETEAMAEEVEQVLASLEHSDALEAKATAPVPLMARLTQSLESAKSYANPYVGPLAASVWSLGSAIMFGLLLLRIHRFRKALDLAKPASERVIEQVEELALRLGIGRIPEVLAIEGDVSPLVWAICRPAVIVLPNALWKRLDARQAEALLTHELAHIARRDHWVRYLELVVAILFWWLPTAWWTRKALRDAEEECCDAWVVWALPGSSRAYAETLVEAVDFLSHRPGCSPVAASGFGHAQHLKRRLIMIMSGNSSRTLGQSGLLAAFGFAALLLPFSPSLGQEPEKTEKVVVIVKDGEAQEVKAIDLEKLKLDEIVGEIDGIIRRDLKFQVIQDHPSDKPGQPGADVKPAEIRFVTRDRASLEQYKTIADQLRNVQMQAAKAQTLLHYLAAKAKSGDRSDKEQQIKEQIEASFEKKADDLRDELLRATKRYKDVARIAQNPDDPALTRSRTKVKELEDAEFKITDEREAAIRTKVDALKAAADKTLVEQKKQIEAAATRFRELHDEEAVLAQALEGLRFQDAKEKSDADKTIQTDVTFTTVIDDDDDVKSEKKPDVAPADQAKLQAEIKELQAKAEAANKEMAEAQKRLAEARTRLREATSRLSKRTATVRSDMKDGKLMLRIERNDGGKPIVKSDEKAESDDANPIKPGQRRVEVRELTRKQADEKGADVVVKAVPPTPAPRRVELRGRVVPDAQEKRISDLEKKLDAILGELKALKKGDKGDN